MVWNSVQASCQVSTILALMRRRDNGSHGTTENSGSSDLTRRASCFDHCVALPTMRALQALVVERHNVPVLLRQTQTGCDWPVGHRTGDVDHRHRLLLARRFDDRMLVVCVIRLWRSALDDHRLEADRYATTLGCHLLTCHVVDRSHPRRSRNRAPIRVIGPVDLIGRATCTEGIAFERALAQASGEGRTL